MRKKVAILGATGSVGLNTLRVIDEFYRDFEVVGLTAADNIGLLARLTKKYKPHKISILNSDKVKKLKKLVGPSRATILEGIDGLNEIARSPEADLVVIAISGSGGLIPTIEAVKKGKTIALANKESIIMAGDIIMREARRSGAKIIPLDSEHNALFQCLQGKKKKDISSVIITCSGGPFYKLSRRRLSSVTPSMALRHPRWKMGKKVTIDSATLMNKGLEIIEAAHLFGISLDKVRVVIHPEALIHGMVEFVDGIFLGLLSEPDMRLPIQYVLYYPMRVKNVFSGFTFKKANVLHFSPPDGQKFPCLCLARKAGRIGGTMPAVLNSANEVAVDAFLKKDIGFLDIAAVVEKVMERHTAIAKPDLDDILSEDRWARKEAEKVIEESLHR